MIIRCPNYRMDVDISSYSSSLGELEKNKRYISYLDIDTGQVKGVLVIYNKRRDLVQSYGTFIRPAYRDEGLGTDLWYTMLDTEKPKKVKSTVVSNPGYFLIKKMMKVYPKIEWIIIDDRLVKRRPRDS